MNKEKKLHDLRRQYQKAKLEDHDLKDKPYSLFTEWFKKACHIISKDPHAMTLATVDQHSRRLELYF